MIEGIEEVNHRFAEIMNQIGGNLTERTVTEILVAVEGYTMPMVPDATSTLRNSQYRRTETTGDGWSGEIGFTARYAQFVHEAPGTLLGTNTLRSPARLGYVWDPDAEPEFLRKGAQEMQANDFSTLIRQFYGVVS